MNEVMNPQDMPETLFFQRKRYDAIAVEAKLIEVKGNYAYYAVCKGSSSAIHVIYIPNQKLNKDEFFSDRKTLRDVVIARHISSIEFIKSQHMVELE